MAILNVRTLQKGLAVWAQQGGSPAPGRIDGSWGPNTHQSLRMYVANNAPQFGLDSARVLAPLRDLPTGTSIVELNDRVVNELETLALRYRRSPSNVRSTTSPDADTLVKSSVPLWAWITGGVTLGLFGLGAFFWWRARRGLSGS